MVGRGQDYLKIPQVFPGQDTLMGFKVHEIAVNISEFRVVSSDFHLMLLHPPSTYGLT